MRRVHSKVGCRQLFLLPFPCGVFPLAGDLLSAPSRKSWTCYPSFSPFPDFSEISPFFFQPSSALSCSPLFQPFLSLFSSFPDFSPSNLPLLPVLSITSNLTHSPNKKIIFFSSLSSKQGGLQICPSSVELTSVRNMNTEVKGKCE